MPTRGLPVFAILVLILATLSTALLLTAPATVLLALLLTTLILLLITLAALALTLAVLITLLVPAFLSFEILFVFHGYLLTVCGDAHCTKWASNFAPREAARRAG